jgi:hypothetical protein
LVWFSCSQVANFAAFIKEHASTPIDIDDLEFEVRGPCCVWQRYLKGSRPYPDCSLLTSLQVTYESEEVLPEDMEGAVKVVKGKSFQDIVSDDTQTRLHEWKRWGAL